jgi:4'-phosphopantetheinyl transferase
MRAAPGTVVDVWSADLDDFDAATTSLSADELERAGAFLLDRDRQRFVAARRLVRVVLGTRLGVAPEALRFGRGTHGKPCLVDPDVPLQFNLSHSGPLALLAVSVGLPVGIDIERVNPALDWMPLSRELFAGAEHRRIVELAPPDRLEAFFACWVRKEAVLKALGLGLAHPLDAFEVTVDPHGPAAVVAAGPPIDPRPWSLQDLPAAPGYRACLASAGTMRVDVHPALNGASRFAGLGGR